jgi:hypothetical protein
MVGTGAGVGEPDRAETGGHRAGVGELREGRRQERASSCANLGPDRFS